MKGDKHFLCTGCGKCCYGQIPLTLQDAFTYSHLFPLCFVWTPVQKGSKDFNLITEIGVEIPMPAPKRLATLIVPTAFIPSTFSCPALVDQKTCSIHREKPSRCKSMPFYPYREERFQGEFLTPKPGWECDTSPAAPLIFQHDTVMDRGDFDREKNALLEQAPTLKRYAAYMLKYMPDFAQQLWMASCQKKGANLITSLSSFLTAIRYPEARKVATQQAPILQDFAHRTEGLHELSDFNRYYQSWAKEMHYLAR